MAVNTNDGPKAVVPLDTIKSWYRMCPELDQNYDFASDMRHPIRMMDPTINNRVALFTGELVTLEVDVIVNTTSRELPVGHGISKAIHLAAGPELIDECKSLVPCKVGRVKISHGYLLPGKAVVHTVGPTLSPDGVPTVDDCHELSDCYRRSLETTARNGFHSIAFPDLGTGADGFPLAVSDMIACKTVNQFLLDEDNLGKINLVVFCVRDEAAEVYERTMRLYFPTGGRPLALLPGEEVLSSDDDYDSDDEPPAETTGPPASSATGKQTSTTTSTSNTTTAGRQATQPSQAGNRAAFQCSEQRPEP